MMEDAELVKKLLSEMGTKSGQGDKKDAESLIGQMAESRINSIKENIQEIMEQIDMRQKLHKEIINDLEKLKSSINNMIPQTPTPSAEFQKAIVEMKKKIVEAEEAKVQEKLNCFRDIAELKKELRELIREFRDKENSANLLGDLLSN